MFKVAYDYSKSGLENQTFKTYEEALAYAEKKAGTDYEGMYWTVSELKCVVQADPAMLPIKTAEISDESFKLLIEQDDEDGK